LPIANISIYVLDKQLNPVPIGIPGELHIGGVGVGRGYYNRPELTAEKFIPDPFSREPGARLYKTGDLVRYLPGGIIEYLGRNDAQIKMRGFRIELGEIETVLDRHPGVRECAVLAREDVPGDKRLVAYVVVEQEWSLSSEDLQHFIKGTLPDYMMPAAFVFLDALPLSPNGKLDRHMLPAPDPTRPLQEVPFVAPRDLIEEMLTDIWSDVLGVERVGIHDDFFALGGHSLLATQVISRIRNTFGVALPLLALFEAPTVAGLVRHIKASQQGEHELSMPPLLPASRSENLPLSFTQQRLWFFDQLEPSNPVYNISGAVRLRGSLHRKAVEQSIHEVVRRHEILRTTFVTVDGRPLQVIAPALTVPLPVVDLQVLSGEKQDAEVLRLITGEMQRPFDLSRGPLLRVNLLKLAEEEYILMLSVHHIVSDGWSTSVFVRELTALYAAFVNGVSSPLPELPVQYADYALWQREWLQGEVLEAQLAYWKQQLEDLPALQLPTDYPRPVVQTFHGANQQIVLPRSLTAALRALSRREGVTLFMTLLAAYQTLLFRYTDQAKFAVGIPIAGRTESKLEGLIGCFINTLALRSDLSGNPTFRELLGRVREVALGAYAHQDLPFEKLVEDLQSDRDLSRSPLFQVMFALQNVPRGQVDLPGLTLTHLRVDSEPALFDLDMTLWESEDEIVGVLNYNTDLFHEDTIKRIRNHFQRLLEDVVEDAGQHLLDLSLLTEPEREQILVEWNTTQTAYPQEHCFHRLFEAQVERTPEAVAVACVGARFIAPQLTYRQLNQCANQVAHHLRDAGVGPESLVALLAERGIPLLTSIVAIFKAGGAYLPLDPQHPASRLRHVLHHSGCRLVLTTSAFASILSEVLEEVPPETRPRVLRIEDLLQQFHIQENLPVGTMTRQLSYVIYTSGSTGKSKGVMVEQQGMLNHLYAKIEALQLSEYDRVAQTASQCFDISVWQFLAALLVGGQVQIFPDEVSHDPEQLLAQVEEQRISILETVPSLLRAMLDVLATSSSHRPKLEALRWLIPTGEALPAELCRSWLNLYPHIPLMNAYGPTECSDDVAHYFVVQAPVGTGSSVPIGRAIGNTRLYVLDRHMRPVPIGVHGELYVGGVGVGRGYLADAGRTVEAFVPDPFSEEPGMRLYRTGDMARYQADGTLEFLGRRDFQVKLRGYRIELGEIEAVLSQHEGVRECVVLTREDVTGNSYLIAYVVPRLEQLPGNELRNFLKEQLPDYMVPSTFVYLETLPLTSNGKLDRHALPAPDVPSAYALDVPFVAPRHPSEEILAGIWAKLLGLVQEQISIRDDFFALGGHSLLTVRLVAEIEKRFGLRLPLITIFQGRTIEALAEIIHQHTISSTVEMQEPTIDLQAEAILDLDTCPEMWSGELLTEPFHLLLTGATGFLGNFLLAELLRQTSAQIYCLVRASSTEEAQQRLQGALESAGLWQSAYRSRLVVIKGDLAQPLLGLSREQFEELADTLEVIYHTGAMVNMLYPYQELSAPNVLGTREVLRVAAHGRIKPLHYISTLSVFSHIPALQEQPILEDELLDEHAQHLLGGYAQSKWVAEKLVTIARSRGLPVTIYRPGRISGHSQTGVWRTDDLICRMMKGCIQLGSVPALIAEERLELTPVDYVSQAIVALSRRKASSGQVFHLFNPLTISIGELIEYANTSGYPVQQVAYDAWADTLAETIEGTTDNALAPLAPLFPRKGQAVQQEQVLQRTFGNQHALAGLADTSITCPPADGKLLSTYFAYLVQSGFLPAPSAQQAANENER
jgi:amino acid adenylation domain-containing protein/thioester reductase-like protein